MIIKLINEFIFRNKDKGFNDSIFQYIIERKLDSVELYKRANLDRRTFSRLYNENYKPSKNTALCLCIALKLDYDETNFMLKKLGYSLSNSYVYDLIISYFIKNKIFDIGEINDYLELNGYQILGAKAREKIKV